MAGNEDFWYLLCVKWAVQLPKLHDVSKSSKFCIRQDSRWFLELTYNNYYCYSLKLCNEVEKNLNQPIVVTTYYTEQGSCYTPTLPTMARVCKSGTELFSASLDDLSQELSSCFDLQKLSFICVFHDSIHPGDEFMSGKTQMSIQTDTVSTDLQSLSRDWSTFLVDQNFSDVKLKCGDRTFSAHKTVLAARSEVFSAMFRSNMAERESGVVEIEDLDPEVLEPILEYMYSGKKPDLSPFMARRLYEAADKYAVYALRKACCEFMVAEMTQEDCVDLLVLGDKHSDEDFKEKISRFIAKNLHLLDRESWSEFKKEHPDLAMQMYEKILTKVLPRQT